MTEENKRQPPSTRQLLELINTVEDYTQAIKPLLTIALDNPCIDMNQSLR